MTAYIIRRLLILPIILFGVTMLIFLMLFYGLGTQERVALYVTDIPRNPAQVQSIINRYGLDDPFLVQYGRWLIGTVDGETGERVGGLIRGDLGYSRTGREPVSKLLMRRLPVTMELAIWAVIPIVGVGIWLGILAALHHNKPIDQITRVLAILGWSFPTFVFGLLALLLFYVILDWFAPGRISTQYSQVIRQPDYHQYTHMITFDALLNLRFDIFWDGLKHLVLPIITLSYLSWALLLKVTRSSMLEALRQDYVTTARAKGLAERTVINRHVRKNALIPVATVAGGTVAGLLNGVVITETIFNIPGLGSAAVEAAAALDALTVLGFALFNASLFVLVNLVIDIMYGILDPRVRLE